MGCTPCRCGSGLANTGIDCYAVFAVPRRAYLVPLYDSTGERNKIDFADIDADTAEQYFTDLVNEADATKRWYPLPGFENVDSTRNDNIVETYNSGTTSFVQYGIKPFLGWIVPSASGNMQPSLIKAINGARCVGELGVIMIDINGNLRGTLSADELSLYPTKIDSSSIAATLIEATDTTNPHINVTWNYAREEKDEDLALITCTELGGSYMLTLRGLIDVVSSLSVITDTSVKVTLITNSGTKITPVYVKGLVLADWISSDDAATGQIYNSTTDANVALVSATENPDGTYTLTVGSPQNEGDELIPMATREGYDFTALEDNPWVVPMT